MNQLELLFTDIKPDKTENQYSNCDLKASLKDGKIFTISRYHKTFFCCAYCKNRVSCQDEKDWLDKVKVFIPVSDYLPLNATFLIVKGESGKEVLSYFRPENRFYLVEKQTISESNLAISVTNRRIINSHSWKYYSREELDKYLIQCPEVSN